MFLHILYIYITTKKVDHVPKGKQENEPGFIWGFEGRKGKEEITNYIRISKLLIF